VIKIKAMSIFIRVQRFASEPSVMRLRGLHHTIGEDQKGILTSDRIAKVFLSIYCIDNRYMLKIEHDSCRLNGVPVARNEQAWIVEGDEISVADYRFLLVPGSAVAELLASKSLPLQDVMDANLDDSQHLPRASVHLGNLSRTFPLFEGVNFDIGSNADCSIYLDAPQIRERHCSLINRKGKIEVHELEGKVSTEPVASDQVLTQNSYIKLEPGNIELKISFPG